MLFIEKQDEKRTEEEYGTGDVFYIQKGKKGNNNLSSAYMLNEKTVFTKPGQQTDLLAPYSPNAVKPQNKRGVVQLEYIVVFHCFSDFSVVSDGSPPHEENSK